MKKVHQLNECIHVSPVLHTHTTHPKHPTNDNVFALNVYLSFFIIFFLFSGMKSFRTQSYLKKENCCEKEDYRLF